MKRNFFRTVFLLLLPSLFLVSCEKNNWFNSESKAKKNLENEWTRVLIPSTIPNEHWIFSGGKLTIYKETSGILQPTDTGSYALDVKLTTISLTLSELEQNFPPEKLEHKNGLWTIVSIDESSLVMAHEVDGGGMIEREFER